ncbi:MAG: hypothetical protein ACLUGJ_19425 [Blautia wexlerae]
MDSYAASYYLQDEKYRDLALSGIVFTKAETCMIYGDNTDPDLVSVINKSIGSLSSQDEEEYYQAVFHKSAEIFFHMGIYGEIQISDRMYPDFSGGIDYTCDC